VTIHLRHPFVVPPNVVFTNLNFRIAESGGPVSYLNGQKIYRANLPAGPTSYTNLALRTLTYYRFGVTLDALSPGTTPGINTILNSPAPEWSEYDGDVEYVLGYAFTPNTNLTATHVRHYFGDKISIWTAADNYSGRRVIQRFQVCGRTRHWRIQCCLLLAIHIT
jgi:hypothetical protein